MDASSFGPVSPFEIGDFVWSPCVRLGFRRGRIVSLETECDSFVVDAQGDEDDPKASGQERVRRSDVRPFFDSGPERTCEDNTSLVHLDDANILQNMYRRYRQDRIYTYTANVLLAINPYKKMQHMYTEEVMAAYKNKNVGVKSPHPYAIADSCYRQLLREFQNQALIISGESGAGKTETAKITMHYLAHVSRTDAAHGGRIQEKIINANPILESFGNASTVRNRNSSRFGKYNEMYFNRVGSLVGAGIKTYLLEASRVVSQNDGERNYHVFYEMLAGLSPDELDAMQLDNSTKYQLLYNDGACVPDEGSAEWNRSKTDFEELLRALSVVGFSEPVQKELFEIMAALIHLGEVQFQCVNERDDTEQDAPSTEASPHADGSGSSQEALVEVIVKSAIGQAADLLGLSEARLMNVLRFRDVHVVSRKSHIRCPRTKTQAHQTLSGIIKILYKRLFEQIVERLNASNIGQAARQGSHASEGSSFESHYANIGTLDIYGFERLKVNSLEQLCINLANERLQQFFVEEVLDAEQKMYKREQITIEFFDLPDARPVVNTIQSIMSDILDEHSRRSIKNLVRQGDDTDQKFCEHIHREHIKDRFKGVLCALKLKADRSGKGLALHDGFVVRHYAGDVPYSTRGWIEKNNDALVPEVESLLAKSSKPLVSCLADAEAIDVTAGERFKSVSGKYLLNLNGLLATLKSCALHYIRCFNPNEKRTPGLFEKRYVLDQVIQCGTVELVRIMHSGFPHRCKLEEIRNRFTNLLPVDFRNYKDRDYVEAIMLAFEIDASQWTVGTSRLFLKAGQLRLLEHLLDQGSMASQEMIARIRRQFARKKLKGARSAISFALWLPRHVKELRKDRMLVSLRKVTWLYVRLIRWLDAARRRIYGDSEPSVATMAVQWATNRHQFTTPVQTGMTAPRLMKRKPQLFVASNLRLHPDFAANMHKDMVTNVQVKKFAGTRVQGQMSESILFFDGSAIISAQLNPRPFLRNDTGHGPADMHAYDECSLADVRYVDVWETGRALPLNGGRGNGVITCLCQQRQNTQMFASCDSNSLIHTWKWLGTDADEPNKPALKCTYQFQWPDDVVYQICFFEDCLRLCSLNDPSIGFTSLFILSSSPSSSRLQLSLVRFNAFSIGCEQVKVLAILSKDGELNSAMQDGSLIMASSHTGRILVLAGTGVMQFYEIIVNDCGDVSLELVEDMALYHPDVLQTSFLSCLCMPPPRHKGSDWIVFGDDVGRVYGFSFGISAGRIVKHAEDCGRFSRSVNLHDTDVPIHLVIPTFGTNSSGHFQASQAKCIAYDAFLLQVAPDDSCFYTMAENGKLLQWNLGRTWEAKAEPVVRPPAGMASSGRASKVPQFIAGHASRLVPHVLILADQEHELLMCIDRSEAVHNLPEGMVCSYVRGA